MGLGKTVQTVSLLHYLHEKQVRRGKRGGSRGLLGLPFPYTLADSPQGLWGPFLVVAPLSTLPHWQREVESWTHMNVVVYHGNAAARARRLHKFNVIITTFEMININTAPGEPTLGSLHWRALVVDEAHRLKNAESKERLVALTPQLSDVQLLTTLKTFSFEHLVLLTGTPLQNNPSELYTLLNFLQPAEFPSEEDWSRRFGDLQNKTQVEKLNSAMRPYLLRRMKADVEKSVPPKEETVVEVELTSVQKQYYRAIYEHNVDFLASGTNHSPTLMNVVMELRKCCNHPYLVDGAEQGILATAGLRAHDPQERLGEQLVYASGKMVLMHKLLPKLRAQGHKVLIFSQMVRVLDILEDYLRWQRYSYERIDGHVKGNDRQAAIDRYSRPDSDRFVFLLCTRAGGVGINLTAADTVVIYDSDWNPQNDLQAQARCHRIGQTKGVKVYRLVTRSTYEEVMFQKASLKLGPPLLLITQWGLVGWIMLYPEGEDEGEGERESKGEDRGERRRGCGIESWMIRLPLIRRGLDQAVLNGIESNTNKKLTAAEVKSLLRHGAYGALQVQHYEAAAEANSSFAKAHFAVNVGGTDVS
ncbi:MAG: hypothetical protein SGPRY_012903, partial [Prymnesium sp.]